MPRLYPVFHQLDVTSNGPKKPWGRFTVGSYNHRAIGGPDMCRISVTGQPGEMWELFDLLRVRMEIRDDRDVAVWWGYPETVEVEMDYLRFGVTLRDMANRIALYYKPAGGGEEVTAWAEDTASSGHYGDKELKRAAAAKDATQDTAEQERDRLIEEIGLPVATRARGGGATTASAVITCKGWWHALGWQYWEQVGGDESYPAEEGKDLSSRVRTSTVEAGYTTNGVRAAMKFTMDAGLPDLVARAVKVWVYRNGAVASNLRAGIWSHNAGADAPNALLGTTGTRAVADIPLELNISEPITITLNDDVTLSAGTTYWIVLDRADGGSHASVYYLISVNEERHYSTEQGYGATSAVRYYDGAAWQWRGTAADMVFTVEGVRGVTNQISDIGTAAQFVQGVEIRNGSAVFASAYRDGSETMLEVVEDLLEVGTTADRRLLAAIDENLTLVVFQEPEKGAEDLYEYRDGTYRNAGGIPIPNQECPVGKWAKLKEFPVTANVRLADPSYVFLEECEYNPARDALRPRARNTPSPWEI